MASTLSIGLSHAVQLRARSQHSWATLRFEERTGFTSIASDFGHWAFHWPPQHRGDRSLGYFLSSLDSDYAGGKFLGGSLNVTCPDKTRAYVRERICAWRREGGLSKERAREEWESSSLLGESIDAWMAETEITDAWDMICTRTNASWTMFWERMWAPLFRPALRKWPERQDEAQAYEQTLEAV